MSNDGSLTRPWKTLAEVVDEKNKLIATQSYPGNYQNSDHKLSDQNPSAPIKPGDIIYLMSGDHGNVEILGAINKDFITVEAARNQTPTLRSLRVNGASKWMFVGLKVQGAGDGSTNSSPGAALVEFGRNLWRGPADNIIFTSGSVSTADDSNSWEDIDWVKKPFMKGLNYSATCVTIIGNHFYNLRDALGIDGDHSLVTDNKIEYFGNDGIDLIASHVVIRNNTIINGRHSNSEPMHADGIQGWTKNGQTNTDITIERNTIIKTGDPEKTYMQGITIFDGKWNGVRILNNVVVTNHWHGISISGVVNGQIINNTVVAFDPAKHPTWIIVNKSKDGTPAQDIVVRNNITTRLVYHGDRIVVDHNIVAKMISTDVSEKLVFFSKPGSYGDHNIIDPEIYDTLVKVDNSNGKYDLRLRQNSPAVGGGNAELAPTVDITGKPRANPTDVGAYAYRN